MAEHTYEVYDEAGQIRKGTLKAETSQEAASQLWRLGHHIISLNQGRKPSTSSLSQSFGLAWLNKVKSKDLVLYNRQLATMLSSGLSLMGSLKILSKQTESRKLGETLRKVEADIGSGASFFMALAKFPEVFSHLYISMVHAGETAGILDEVLTRLAAFMEKEEKTKRDIKTATLYPKLLMGVVTGGILFLFNFVLPQFLTMFSEFGGELPFATRMLIFLVNFATDSKYVIAGLFLVLIPTFLWFKKTARGKFYYDLLQMKFPVMGKLVRKTAISRVCRTLGVLYGSGVLLPEALETVKEIAGNEVVARALSKVGQSVQRGTGIAEPLEKTGVFPPMPVYMIKVGEETGKLGLMLEKIADFYDEEIEFTVKNLSSALEPLLLGVMALAVGFIVVSIYFPMFDMTNVMKIK